MGSDSLSGRTIGEFVLRERIGEGGFGAVYRCEQPLLGREAVVKVLHHRLTADDVILQRFLREAKLASRIDHPYAAHVYAFGVEPEDGLFWIAMEMVHGTTLDRWLASRGPLPLDQLVALFERVAEVVQTAHDRGIIHRDLKPSNIMVMERAGRLLPKLLDLGIAKLVDDTHTPAAVVPVHHDTPTPASPLELTQTNAMLGSPPYMSPEQFADPLRVGHKADLYALGVIAYEALTGQRPFEAPTIAGYVGLHLTAGVPPVGDKYPPALDEFFARALAKQPAERFGTALELAEALRIASGTSRTGTSTVTLRAPRRTPWLAIGAALVVIAGGAAAFVITSRGGTAPAGDAAVAIVAPADAPASIAVAPDAAPSQPATVLAHIDSTPAGAEVFRFPELIKVGVTPWESQLPAAAGAAVFVVKKSGYRDVRVEIDLRSGGQARAALPPIATKPGDRRHKGEPVDPFKH